MAQKRKTQCPHCEESFTIIWEEVDLEPWTCPFCGEEHENLDEDMDAVNWDEED